MVLFFLLPIFLYNNLYYHYCTEKEFSKISDILIYRKKKIIQSIKWRNLGFMAEVKVLKHSVVMSGKSFDDCKAEYDRICNGVKKDFGDESDMQKLIFSDMTVKEDECVAVFQIPESYY